MAREKSENRGIREREPREEVKKFRERTGNCEREHIE
jgi:hypothetical protein